MRKKMYEKEIINTYIRENEKEKIINERYEKLNSLMEPMYDFISTYSNYYSIRRDYGTGSSLTMIEAHILTQIYDNKGITVSELAEIWCKSTSAISQTVKKLINWELVERISSQNDAKVFHLFTTKKAKEIVLAHKKYDNLDIVKTKKKLLEKFSLDEILAFDAICEEYTKLLRKEKKIKN